MTDLFLRGCVPRAFGLARDGSRSTKHRVKQGVKTYNSDDLRYRALN